MEITPTARREAIETTGKVLAKTFSAPRQAPVYRVTLSTPQGVIVIAWLGRHSVPGVNLGSRLAVSGIPVLTRDGVTLINPNYHLLRRDNEG